MTSQRIQILILSLCAFMLHSSLAIAAPPPSLQQQLSSSSAATLPTACRDHLLKAHGGNREGLFWGHDI